MFGGRIRIKQDSCGYRFSIDAVLLANQTKPQAGERILDLGTGCGVVALLLGYRHPQVKIYGVEVQEELYKLAQVNVADNRMQDRIVMIHSNMKSLTSRMISGLVDMIVCNPPYRRPASGRVNPDQQRAIARHEILVTLADVLSTARRMLRTGGRFVTIYTAERLAELLAQMKIHRIEPKIIRSVHSTAQADAKLILAEGIKGAGPGMSIQAPLILYGKDGEYSQEVRKMFIP
jgi:tRNA1Val (adenine37-N6)-methyltransferase